MTLTHNTPLKAFVMAFCLIVLTATSVGAQAISKRPNILVIHSYQFGHEQTTQLTQGIDACISDNQLSAEVFFIHLDAKRISTENKSLQRLDMELSDYKEGDIDLIIVCSDWALSSLLELDYPARYNVPVVFCGIEAYNPDMLVALNNLTGVAQHFDFVNTFKEAVKLFPKSKNVFVVTGNSSSGRKARSVAEKELEPLLGDMTIEYLDGSESYTTAKLFNRAQHIPKESIVIMSDWLNGYNEDEYMRARELVPLLAETCPAPIFTVDEINLGHGVIGGSIHTGFDQAYKATEMGIDILKGRNIATIPILNKKDGAFIFDYNQFERWDIKSRKLPKTSLILNKPEDFIKTYSLEIIIVAVILSFLIFTILFIVLYHFKYRTNIKEKEALLKTAQHKLMEQRNLLSNTFSCVADGVLAINCSNELTAINPVALEYLGLTEDSSVYMGVNVSTLLHIRHAHKEYSLDRMIDEAMSGNEPVSLPENSILIPLNEHQETMFVSGSISKMLDDAGMMYGAVITVRDVTNEHKQREELIRVKNKALESDKLKTAFLANMSHEIRTPLNGIVGFANLLAEGDYEEEEKEQYIEIINTNCVVLLSLITDILDLSRIESGSLSFRMEECAINPLIENVTNTLTVSMPENVELLREIPQENVKIITDSLRLTQVLTNLINNAIKFTTQGSITVGYEIVDEGANVHFFVRDTGCGMTPEDTKKIFGRFFKKSEFAQGAGLGLAICDAIIEKFGGTISVESELGVGTSFHVIIPYFKSANYLHPDVAEANMRNKMLAKREKVILVAEDDNSNFKLIEAVLSKDYKIIRAKNGLEAVEIFKTQPIDLILMDVKMPEKTGIEALIEIRQISTDIPIIMQTAYAFDTDKREALETGANGFITKPIQVEVLKASVKEHLESGTGS